VSTPGDDIPTVIEGVERDFSVGFIKGFVFVILAATVMMRLYVGVRQRLARERNIIDIDPDA
jgi:hypothetical protein